MAGKAKKLKYCVYISFQVEVGEEEDPWVKADRKGGVMKKKDKSGIVKKSWICRRVGRRWSPVSISIGNQVEEWELMGCYFARKVKP